MLCLILTFLKSLLLEIFEGLGIVLDTEFIGLLLAFKGVLELKNSLFLERLRDVIRKLDMGDDDRLDKDSLGFHYFTKMIHHSFGLLISTDALNLARAHTTDHVPHTLSDGCL